MENDSQLLAFEESNADLIQSQMMVRDRLDLSSDKIKIELALSEKELKKTEKWVKEQIYVIEETKKNFAYIFSKLKYI